MDAATLTVEQLKALAFDMIMERDRAVANLDAIARELANREQTAPEAPEAVTEPKKKPADK